MAREACAFEETCRERETVSPCFTVRAHDINICVSRCALMSKDFDGLKMIVIYRNGERSEISGWRAWLFWLAAGAGIVAAASLIFSLALTLFTFFLFALPVAIILALIAALVQKRV